MNASGLVRLGETNFRRRHHVHREKMAETANGFPGSASQSLQQDETASVDEASTRTKQTLRLVRELGEAAKSNARGSLSASRQTTRTVARIMDGRLRLELRDANPIYYARTFIQGKHVGKSTGERNQAAAERVAREWYLKLLMRDAGGQPIHGKTFEDAAKSFLHRQDTVAKISDGERRNRHQKWALLKPLLTGIKLAEIDLAFLERLRDQRAKVTTREGQPLSPSTLKKDLIFVRMVLRHAVERERWLERLPAFPSFKERDFKILPNPRPFFTGDEARVLVDTAQERMLAPGLNPRVRRQRTELFFFISLCIDACLRVEEAYSLRFRDCEILSMPLDGKERRVLRLSVLGKHSPNGRLREEAWGFFGSPELLEGIAEFRSDAQADDRVFLHRHRDGFRELLNVCGMRATSDGKKRDLKSLRPTGISLRLDMAGPNADYRAMAKYARTSPEMIAKFYDQTRPQALLGKVSDFAFYDKIQATLAAAAPTAAPKPSRRQR